MLPSMFDYSKVNYLKKLTLLVAMYQTRISQLPQIHRDGPGEPSILPLVQGL
jgi:hypothetical protein